ncbi:sugar ABC transporter substrate-binding protein [Butyricicoccus faecihominis]|uniref:sugar ABC transporter substrate-binding protein n=1 Tax=Butyricicoccaceae TaxID=3085642 RepID=UPI002478BCA4|nr:MULTISPECIES: sugar ABC transporter substrate-binding protein [Butyricicoccaceae]MCQ5130351.1 sugar ABC transporter substrate-binding protein [Butyricicoccus faecihominis]WNX83861.1 sugar ABC transporter substrate-binding protein [Agathobaculum sp. NTUH-O15-33]
MKKRLFAMLLASAMLTGMLSGCGDKPAEPTADGDSAGTSDASTPAGDGNYSIDVILKTTASEYWQYVQAGALAYAKENPNVKVEVKGAPSETSYDEQLNMIQTDLSSDYDGYVIAPLQADMVANLVKGQTKPIVAVDTKIEAPEVLSFIGTGNESAGKLGGEAAAKLAKERGWEEIKCIEIAGVQGDTTNTDRMNGYKAGVEAAGGEFLDSEVQYADAVPDKAVAAMEGIISKFPEGVAIICANNDDMAMAAAKVAADNENYKNTVFLGFDGIQSACTAILEGRLTMSVAQQGYEMGYKSVEAVVNKLNGQEIEAFIDSGADIVNADNAQERKDTLQGYLDSVK